MKHADAPYKWIIVVEVAEHIVADGLDLTPELTQEAFERAFPFVRSSEITATVVKAPAASRIAKTQGYKVKK